MQIFICIICTTFARHSCSLSFIEQGKARVLSNRPALHLTEEMCWSGWLRVNTHVCSPRICCGSILAQTSGCLLASGTQPIGSIHGHLLQNSVILQY